MLTTILTQITHKTYRKRNIILLVSAIVLVLGGISLHKNEAPAAAQEVKKVVDTIAISDLKSDGGTIPLTGSVKANQQIDLHPLMPGQVSAVRVSLNQSVRAGQILVEVNHRDLDAAVAQASAGVQSALAALNKMKNGARPEDVVIAQQNLESAKQQLEEMQNGARPEELAQAQLTVQSAEQAAQDAKDSYDQTVIQQQTLQSNALENGAQSIQSAQFGLDKLLEQDLTTIFDKNNQDRLKPFIKDPVLENEVNGLRIDAGQEVDSWRAQTIDKSHEQSLISAMSNAETIGNDFLHFLDRTGDALQDVQTSPDFTSPDLSTAISTVNTARTTVKGYVDTLIAQRQAIVNLDTTRQQALDAAQTKIDSTQNALDKANEQLQLVEQGPTDQQIAIQQSHVTQAEQQLLIAQNGARPEDLQLQQASVSQARASLALAAANREKAIVRAPISGKVTYLPLHIGDIVGNSTIAVSLANDNGLEVETYVTEQERNFLDAGGAATIEDNVDGVIREISPALEPTNKKIKVLITVTTDNPQLTLGQTARVSLQKKLADDATLSLPLSAVQVRSNGASVFAVQDGVAKETPVTIGRVTGSYIEVTSSLDDGLVLVKDARGLRDGQPVEVK